MGKLGLANLQFFAASGSTKIADVIIPEVFSPYVLEQTTKLNKLIRSGIVVADPKLDELASKGGNSINMPFWQPIGGGSQVLSDKNPLTVNKITTEKDKAVLHLRGNAWGANELASALAGDDAMDAIASQVAEYWVGEEQSILLSSLKGVFASTSMSSNVHDISGATADAALIGSASFIDAKTKLGDHSKNLTAVMMHSKTVAYLEKQRLLEYTVDPLTGKSVATWNGREVIEDDDCPVEGEGAAAVYTTYLFAKGAVGRGEGKAPTPTETDRDSLLGEDVLINRRHFILHPRGVRFNDLAVVGEAPTNTELEVGTEWTRVYQPKNIGIVQFKHKIG